MTERPAVQPSTRVPDDETPAARCPHCDRPFPSEQLHDLHVGQVHSDSCTEAERTAFEAATDEERDDLFVYHLKIIAALVALYAALIIVYMVVLGTQPG